ncbi:MAG: hypothetical protein VKP63_05120 [Cyanobacteriota bacterium]|nr:hypothetical protein [Cyanobacteriota bacterium]
MPLLASVWIFLRHNWLHGPQCAQNILHNYWKFIVPEKIDNWAEPYTMCLDPYWVNQWLKNYGAGFVKRGFLGEMSIHLFGDRINLFVLNLLALALIIALAYGVVFLLVSIGRREALSASCVFVSLLWLTPVGRSLAETALDPLQVSIALLILAVILTIRSQWHDYWRDTVLMMSFLLSILVHEGSFLLLLPACVVVGRKSWVWWIGLGIAVATTFAFSGEEPLMSQSLIAGRLIGFNPHTGLEISYRAGGAIASQVSFFSNLKMEVMRYVAEPMEIAGDAYRTLVLIFFYALCIISWLQVISGQAAMSFFKIWLLYIPVTFPFFFITHDWVRYGVVNLLSCLVCTSALVASVPAGSTDAAIENRQRPSKTLVHWPWLLLLLMALIFGPHLHDKDIRTHPQERLGKKYTLLCLAGITVVAQQRRLNRLNSFVESSTG